MLLASGRVGLLTAAAVLAAPLAALATLAAGCHSAPKVAGLSPLKAPQMSPDSVVLEVFRVRFPFGDPEANVVLWEEVDEQHVPTDVRRRLARNGFRVGLLGGQVPIPLSRLLELKEKPAPTGEGTEVRVAEVGDRPPVERAHITVRSGARAEVLASGEYETLPALVVGESGELGGQMYEHAQGVLAVRAFPLPDGRVRLELTPEVHHDAPRPRWVGKQGMWRIETGRPRRAFDELALEATLSPGSMLVLSSLPTRSGSLGHYFLTEDQEQLTQKLILVRLCQTQHDEVCAAGDVLDLDALEVPDG
jgi:hypothetical protein